MSKSNASAKQRRAFGNVPVINNTASQSTTTPSATSTSGLTLQQVISLFDRRIIHLESFVKETKEDSNRKIKFEDEVSSSSESITNLPDIINEFNSRFDVFAQEIGELKDIVLKLQTYTMDVNKTLMNERIHLLSDLGTMNASTDAEAADLTVENIPGSEETPATTMTIDASDPLQDTMTNRRSRTR
jgi:hypothetical protein